MAIEHKMILSASGWRKVFAQSGGERDATTKIGDENKALCFLAAESFLEWLNARNAGNGCKTGNAAATEIACKTKNGAEAEIASKPKKAAPQIVVATDTRPTGKECAEYVLRALALGKAKVVWLGAAAAPEIMAFARGFDGFIYISASHNPIGHNGIKFGLNDGGVLNAAQNLEVRAIFERKLREADGATENACKTKTAEAKIACKAKKRAAENDGKTKIGAARAETAGKTITAAAVIARAKTANIKSILAQKAANKKAALAAYQNFSRRVISGLENIRAQDKFFDNLKAALKKNKITVCADFNGSARALCIDKNFFSQCGAGFKAINARPGQIVHEIIPEPENLAHVARFVESVAAETANGRKTKTGAACAETACKTKKAAAHPQPQTIIGYMPDCDGDRGNIVYYSQKSGKAKILKAQEVFALSVLAELSCAAARKPQTKTAGKAKNSRLAVAVNCPTSMRIEEIAAKFGAKVFRAEVGEANVVNLAREKRAAGWEVPILGEGSNGGTITYPASVRDPLNTVFALIKLLTMQNGKSLDDILDSLPKYTTTGVSESRAILKIKTSDHALLKKNFQRVFESSYKSDSEGLVKKYNITSWKASLTNGTKEKLGATDFSKSQKGGLKILFYENNSKTPASFIWMRGSGTEPVFRIMCDVKGTDAQKEKDLLAWETKLLAQADKMR